MRRTSLADETAARLYRAGLTADDPGLVQIRAWNAAVAARGGLAGVTGSTNPGTPGRRATDAPAGLCGNMGATFASPQEAIRPECKSAPQMGSAATTTESDRDLVAIALAGSATGPAPQPDNQRSRR
jgi:hypothetical protein